VDEPARKTPEAGAGFWARYITATLLVVFLLPLLVFTGCLVLDGYGLPATIAAVSAQYGAERQNLFLAGVPGLLPYALLALIVAVHRWRRGHARSTGLALSGGLPIAFVLAWANASFWPLHLPGRDYPGWPHGLEMVIAPLFFAPVAMAAGLLVYAAARRSR
jgi:hypothetical protein